MSFMVWCLDSNNFGIGAIIGSSLLEGRCANFLSFDPPLEIMVAGGGFRTGTGVCSLPVQLKHINIIVKLTRIV